MTNRTKRSSGLPAAFAAYIFWGLLPLYLHLIARVPAMELVGWRVLFSLPICFGVVLVRGQIGAVIAAVQDRRAVLMLAASAGLIGANWMVYITTIQRGHVFAASLGYYINPLVNVLAGTVFLGERLTRRQWQAVALAGMGVGLLALAGGSEGHATLLISLFLALTFSAYGMVRKLVSVEALPGLTVETAILSVPAVALIYYGAAPTGIALRGDIGFDLLVAASGLATAVPLLLFAHAARSMDYSTMGFIQFVSPTIVFLLGLTVFHEPLKPVQLGCFVLIWAALALFCQDLLARRRAP